MFNMVDEEKVNLDDPNKINDLEPLTMIELFSGIGAQKRGIDNTGLYDCEVIATSDIDKDAIVSYAAIHNGLTEELVDTYEDYPSEEEMRNELVSKNIGFDFKKETNTISRLKGKKLKTYWLAMKLSKNLGDISYLDELPQADFWTYSFPCTDISVAGKQEGIVQGKTRSGLLYEVERLLERAEKNNTLPKYLMLENVKNLVGKQFKPQFEEWLQKLDELGYNSYWQVLNGKDYMIPQNRERVFAISIRKDIDTGYVFPEPFELKIRLKDILEKEVDEKYYINNEKADKLIRRLNDTNQLTDKINPCDRTINEPKVKDISNCIKARYDCGVSNQRSDGTMVVETMNQKRIGGLYDGETKHQAGSAWDSNHVAPTVDTMQGGNRQPCVLIPQATKQGYIECNIPGVVDLSFPNSKTRRGRVQENGEICPTLMAGQQDICYIDQPCIAASRGRNPENLSDRTVGSPTKQRLEINKNGTSNTLTTVQKDNYVLEPMENDQEYINNISDEYKFTKTKTQEMFDSNGCLPEMFNPYNKAGVTEIAPTQTTMCGRSCSSATVLIKQPQFRIRKLTPLECWRLMGFTDEQFRKAEKVNSNSQLYKQAGNSIITNCIQYLMIQLYKAQVKDVDVNFQIPQA